ncbi:MAG: hypothetical protein WAM89_17015 [Terriglobales bacterium]
MYADGNIKWLFSIAIPAISALVGVVIGAYLSAWLNERREKGQRRYAFRERQLREFYSPLLSLRTEVKVRMELWNEICDQSDSLRDPSVNRGLENANRVPSETHTEHVRELFGLANKMLSIFRDNLCLADSETRPFYETLLKYVWVWEKQLTPSIPAAITYNMNDREPDMKPFYDHLKSKHDELREPLADGSA